MAVDPAILTEIGVALSGVSASITATSAPWDAFEAYAFSLVLKAARNEGANVTLRDVYGVSPPTTFVFRTSPGYIGSMRQPYGYATISFEGEPTLEAHVGVRVSGSSKVLHECDVCVLLRDEADVCRRKQNASPRSSQVILAMECKYYSTGLPIDLARSFLGLSIDIKKEDRFFVINTESTSIQSLLTKHGRSWSHHVVPSSVNDIARLVGVFADVLKRYKNR